MHPTFVSRSVFYGVVLGMGLAGAGETAGCPICIGFPQKSDADFLLDGSCVLLARPRQEDPFRYAPRDVLKGTYDGSEIDLLVDSATRRLLEVHEDRHVLLVRENPNGAWRTLGPISGEFEAMARRLVAAGSGWSGPNAAEQRWQFFRPLFGHADERIAELAYLEMGRAPYPVVRQLGRTVARETFAPLLQKRRYVEWQGLAILLLAQSNAESDRQHILNSFQTAERLGIATNLAAWAAAAIEIDPRATIDQIEERYFRHDGRTPAELTAVVRALSMHGSQPDPPLRDCIVASYGVLLKRAPELAPHVANDLLAWQRTEWTEILTEILNQPETLDLTGAQAVQRYLRAASSAATTGRVHE